MNVNDFFFYNNNASLILNAFTNQISRRYRQRYGRYSEGVNIPTVNLVATDKIKAQLIELMSKPEWQSVSERLYNLSLTESNDSVSVGANSAVLRQDNFTFPIEIWDEVLSNISTQIEIAENSVDLFSVFDDDDDSDVTLFNPKFSPKSGIRFYGLEVEFNSATTSLEEVKTRLTGLGKIITDGSCGYEMVSPPWEFDDMIDYINSLPLDEVMVDERCGVHIHVSRDIFTPLMLGRLLVFINDPDNLEYITRKVGRSSNRYCAIANKGKDPTKVKLDSPTRYEAINLTNYNEDKYTIEFRMFASTTDKQTVKNYLTWLDTMITLSQTSDLSIDLIESAI